MQRPVLTIDEYIRSKKEPVYKVYWSMFKIRRGVFGLIASRHTNQIWNTPAEVWDHYSNAPGGETEITAIFTSQYVLRIPGSSYNKNFAVLPVFA